MSAAEGLSAIGVSCMIARIDRDIGGNMTVSGSNLIFSLPPVPTGLRDYVVGLHGSNTASGRTITQQTFSRLDGVFTPTVPMHPVPTVTSPTPGGTIAATGFTVQLASPANTMYTVLELCSETVISASPAVGMTTTIFVAEPEPPVLCGIIFRMYVCSFVSPDTTSVRVVPLLSVIETLFAEIFEKPDPLFVLFVFTVTEAIASVPPGTSH